MDLIIQFIDNHADDADLDFDLDFITSEIVTHMSFLQRNANNPHANIVQSIRQITDVGALDIMRIRCIKAKTILSDERAYAIQMQNVDAIVSEYKKYKWRDVKQCEIDLLQTMIFISHYKGAMANTIKVIFNGVKHRIILSYTMQMYVYVLSDCDAEADKMIFSAKQWINNDVMEHAFMAKMTMDEYKTFMLDLSTILKTTSLRSITFEHTPRIFTISIANLLLCAMHEQYPQNITVAEMSKADFVFHDEYLLKCITSIEWLVEKDNTKN